MNIPKWVNWIAQDADGTWWGYEVEPNQSQNSWYENEVGHYIKLEISTPNPDWRTSLTKVYN